MPVGITFAPLAGSDGSLVNIVATVRDITRFREAEELKSTFISVISHELRTPVALIKGYVSTLRREDATWDRKVVRDSLQVIEEEADRLKVLIENLLDASRLQAGALAINQTDVVLKALTERIAERFRTQTQEQKIVVDFPDEFPIILADEDRISQVLSNLISNAIKYSPSGGEIRITGQVLPGRGRNLLRALGRKVTEDQVVRAIERSDHGQDPLTQAGAGVRALQLALEGLGYREEPRTFPDQGTALDVLWTGLARGTPALLAVDQEEHWVTAVGLLGPRFLVADPANAEIVISLTPAELARRWHGPAGYFMLETHRKRRTK